MHTRQKKPTKLKRTMQKKKTHKAMCCHTFPWMTIDYGFSVQSNSFNASIENGDVFFLLLNARALRTLSEVTRHWNYENTRLVPGSWACRSFRPNHSWKLIRSVRNYRYLKVPPLWFQCTTLIDDAQVRTLKNWFADGRAHHTSISALFFLFILL